MVNYRYCYHRSLYYPLKVKVYQYLTEKSLLPDISLICGFSDGSLVKMTER